MIRHTAPIHTLAGTTGAVLVTTLAFGVSGSTAGGHLKPDLKVEKSHPFTLPKGAVTTLAAHCPPGYKAISGGFVQDAMGIVESAAMEADDSYAVTILNPPSNPLSGVPGKNDTIVVEAYCAPLDEDFVP